VAVPILDDRRKTGKLLGGMMSNVKDLKTVFVLSEMRLNFEPFEGIVPEDFIHGLQQAIPKGTVVIGGNGMNNPDHFKGEGLESAQFFNGKPLEGYVVAMGVGGKLKVLLGRAHEFVPSEESVTATRTAEKWILSLNDRPAARVYREIRGMSDEEKFTSDWMHPVGIEMPSNELYLQMILNWADLFGRDKDGRKSNLPPGSLRLASKLEKGTPLRVLRGGDSADAIVSSAHRCVRNLLKVADDEELVPQLLFVSSCCMRGMRLRAYRRGEIEETRDGIIKAMGEDPFPMFGFYAFGEIGPLGGKYKGLSTRFQQNMFLAALIAIDD
jgi:hypothetical protein